ncbi:hypothetical protein HDK77DRAFT_223536 [Phyllosticta capitalensis]|uniref:Uncharacterized protein n=1 Tax=Phyllosticta capitalensis TaxID=121624 RepID=A0ABR1Z4E1_9PEZI
MSLPNSALLSAFRCLSKAFPPQARAPAATTTAQQPPFAGTFPSDGPSPFFSPISLTTRLRPHIRTFLDLCTHTDGTARRRTHALPHLLPTPHLANTNAEAVRTGRLSFVIRHHSPLLAFPSVESQQVRGCVRSERACGANASWDPSAHSASY